MTTAKTDRAPTDESAILRELAEALRKVRRGELKVRLPRRAGMAGEVADAFNDVVALQERQNIDVRRISRIVGRDGRLTERLDEEGLEGAWAEGQRAINSLIDRRAGTGTSLSTSLTAQLSRPRGMPRASVAVGSRVTRLSGFGACSVRTTA